MTGIKTNESDEFISLSNGLILFRFNKNKGTYDLINETEQIEKISDVFYEIYFRSNATAHKISSKDGKEWKWEISEITNDLGTGKKLSILQRAPFPEVSQATASFQIIFTISLFPENENIYFQLEIQGIDTPQLFLQSLRPFIYQHGNLPLVSPPDLKILKTDWQSWSSIVLVDLDYSEPRSNLKVERRSKHSIGKKPKKGQIISDYFSALKNLQTKAQIFLGFITLANQITKLRWTIKNKNKIERIDAYCLADSILMEAGAQFESELLMVSFKKSVQILEEWAEITGKLMKKRAFKKVPVGWCSWYQYWKNVDEEKMLINIEAAKKFKELIPLEYIQLDDGYEPHNALGDWLETEPKKFPKGLKDLAHKINEAGFKAGIWLAPFLITNTSKVFREHPDWIIKDANGKKVWGAWPFLGSASLLGAFFWDRVYALDLTNPEVQEWLKNIIRTLVKEFGYSYLKIDFIYAGAIEGVRYNPKMTRVQAYRKGLEIIREAAGEETFILGCGAPFGPSIGIVDAMRVSTDTAPSFDIPLIVSVVNNVLMAKIGDIPSLRNAMQQNMLRYMFHNHFWINDPDTLIVRHQSKLKPEEIRFEVTAIGMLGGLLFTSDNMANYTPEEINLIQILIPPSGKTARPLWMLKENYPSILVLDAETEFDTWKLVGFFNWTEETAEFEINLHKIFRTNNVKYHLFEFWSKDYLGIHEETVPIDKIESHSTKLFAIHPVKDIPTLLSTSFHITQGLIEVKKFEFSPEAKALHISLEKPGKNSGSLYIYVPESLINSDITLKGDFRAKTLSKNLLIVDLEFQDVTDLVIDFT